MNTLFENCIESISNNYERLDHQLGWRFLSVSKEVLNNNPKLAFVSLNPGGDHISPNHPTDSCENGCAYMAERWGNSPAGQSPLQRQVQMMFAGISKRTGETSSSLMESSLIGHLVPFRSPSLSKLANKRESFEFGRELWTDIMANLSSSPGLIICISRDVYNELTRYVLPSLGAKCINLEAMPTGWGTYTADVDYYEQGERKFAVLRLPHLSRFALFGRPASRMQVNAILDKACAFID
jgi:hypothetical protein